MNCYSTSGILLCLGVCFSALFWRADAFTGFAEPTTPKRDVCQEVLCASPRVCKPDEDGGPSCVCPEICPDIFLPVCGSDNKTYANSCELRSAACQSNTNITEAHSGSCDQDSASAQEDPCAAITCPPGKHCEFNSTTNQTTCECNQICYLIYRPVCGSDNVTYSNDCFLRVRACTTGTNITEVHDGPCNPERYCDGEFCPSPGRCETDSRNRSSCVCPEMCPAVYDPVCGSNGKTYGNTCELIVEACKTKTDITVAHNGTCRIASPCDTVKCAYPRRCVVDSRNRTSCVCPRVCPRIYYPVCGSDGKNYNSPCELRNEACRTNKNITVAYDGKCVKDPCSKKVCPVGKTCVVKQGNRPTCECRLGCPKIYSPVCGTDNQTYGNECILLGTSCVNGTNVTVAYMGECRSNLTNCSQITCPEGKTCVLTPDNGPRCACSRFCTLVFAPVCGTDGQTYINACYLRRYACVNNLDIRVAYKGRCKRN